MVRSRSAARNAAGFYALLVVKRGQVLAADRIAEELRDGDAERTRGTVHTYVSQLRKLLAGADGVALSTRPAGYVLDLPEGALDAARFEMTARAAAAEDDLGRRVELCDAALGLWRGTPLEEFSGCGRRPNGPGWRGCGSRR